MAKRELPNLLKLGVADTIAELQREENDLLLHLRQTHQPLFRSFREELRRMFLGHFVLKRNPRKPPEAPPEQVWDPLSFQGSPDLDEQLASFDELMDALHESDDQLFEEELDWAFLMGHQRELWMLELGGLSVEDYVDRLPEDDARLELLLLAGVAGLSWRDRLTHWVADTRQKEARWLRSSIIGERTLMDTLDGFDRIAAQHDTRVTSLLGNELHRAVNIGADTALEAAAKDHELMGIWVARTNPDGSLDRLVCSLCAELHMTVTDLQPVMDSHPNCRCIKVPLPADYQPNPVTFTEFIARYGTEE